MCGFRAHTVSDGESGSLGDGDGLAAVSDDGGGRAVGGQCAVNLRGVGRVDGSHAAVAQAGGGAGSRGRGVVDWRRCNGRGWDIGSRAGGGGLIDRRGLVVWGRIGSGGAGTQARC